MTPKTLSVAEFKATLSDAIRCVETGIPIIITRHDKPVAALVRVEDLFTLERLRAAGPQQGLASIVRGWEESDDLVSAINSVPRRGRRKPESVD